MTKQKTISLLSPTFSRLCERQEEVSMSSVVVLDEKADTLFSVWLSALKSLLQQSLQTADFPHMIKIK